MQDKVKAIDLFLGISIIGIVLNILNGCINSSNEGIEVIRITLSLIKLQLQLRFVNTESIS